MQVQYNTCTYQYKTDNLKVTYWFFILFLGFCNSYYFTNILIAQLFYHIMSIKSML